MKTKVCDLNPEAENLLPPKKPDGSRIGVNYVDAFVKPMNVQLGDGRKVACKRKGLKLILTVGDKTGEAIMNRLSDGPDPKTIFNKALDKAATAAGVKLSVEEGAVYFE